VTTRTPGPLAQLVAADERHRLKLGIDVAAGQGLATKCDWL